MTRQTYRCPLIPYTTLFRSRIAAFLPDGDGETVPSNVEEMPYPIHALQMTAMGMCISDSLQLEDVARACQAEGRWERSVEHTSELQSRRDLVCRLLFVIKNR